MACENLLQVILRRLYREASLPDSAASKHQLAVAAGFNPTNEHSSSHLNEFDSYVRVTHIFDGDDDVYKSLKFASDHFEHGSRGFDKVQDAAETSADAAFRYVRRAILREIGVPADSPLFTDTKYDIPQPGWQPVLQVTGSYTSDVEEEWPHFYGMSIFPEVSRIVDIDDDQKRTVDFKLNASGAALLHGQTVTPESSLWIIPVTADRKFEQVGDPVMEFTHATETAAASEAGARVGFLRRW